MSEKLSEARCRCGELLFKGSGEAVIECKCWKCRAIVRATVKKDAERFIADKVDAVNLK